jgi:tetratricopeptide (TPR) repeat protein
MLFIKNIKRIMALAIVGAVSMSCLDEDSSSVVSPDSFFYTVEQCQASVNSAYIPLKSIYTFRYLIAVEGVTDLASTNGSAQVDARLLISPASSGIGPAIWKQCYIGVRNTTCAIFGIENSPLPYDETFRQLCEAKILRAYYYYTLTCFFGDVPFYKDYVREVGDLEKVATLPRMSADKTRKALCDELLEIAPKMAQIPTSQEKDFRCGAAMAWMLIAKMSMWNKDWQTALEALKKLEAIYGDLSQYSVNDIMYRNKNTAESIFEIQHAYEKGGITYASNCASACMPYPRSADTHTYDGVDIPELGSEATAWSPLRPTSYMKNSVMPSSVQDDRRTINMASSYGEHKFSTTWMGPKFWCPGQYKTQDSNNYKIFRYADAVLMMSECCCELGRYTESIEYLNKVRSRANLALHGEFKNIAKLRDEIRKERARELFGEFQRKFDLVRWGIWYSFTAQYNTYSDVQNNIRPCHEYYPIPDQQVIASKHNLTNDEYKKYGL